MSHGRDAVSKMVPRRGSDRNAFMNGDLSTVMSPAYGNHLGRERRDLQTISASLSVSPSLNKCDELERSLVAEFYQRCFGEELPESAGERQPST